MKTALIFTLLSLSSFAFACPNLAGSFQCYDDEFGYFSMKVTQSGSGKKTVFTVVDEIDGKSVYRADNKWRSVNQDGMKGKERYFCKNGVLNYTGEFNEPQAGKIIVSAKVSLDSSTDLQTTSNVSVNGQSFPSESSTCTRQ